MPVDTKTYRTPLSRPLFSVRNSKTLLSGKKEFENVKLFTDDSMKRLNDNMNRLSDILGRKGIRLCFMPVVDKYNLYCDYSVGKKRPRNPFFEKFSKQDKKYLYIDTKALLLEEVNKGEKDVFLADDAHWSYKAPKKIFETFRFE